jgi:DNA-binding transcriptional regulator YhcF (GntR family)
MTVSVLKNHPQKFTIEGIKFFKNHLDKLRYDSMVTDQPITTSEISVFMILHLYTDEMGQIRSLTKDTSISDRKLLCVSNLATDHNLNYETVKKAFDSLIARNYVAEVYSDRGMHYEIVDYGKYNQQIVNSVSKETASYFRIPLALFQERIFGSLIKHRYHKGPILLLELSQYFTVQLGTNRRNVEDFELVKGERTMSYLKKVLNTTAKRVRSFLDIIHNVFLFKPVAETIKNPSIHRTQRKRSFVQICIEKFSFSLNGACFKRNEEQNEQRSFARVRKEMAARIKHARIPVKWREMKDIEKSLSRMVRVSTHLQVVNKAKSMLDYTVSKVADTLEDLHTNGEIKSIRRIGAFVNKCFSNAFSDYKESFSEEEKMKIEIEYHKVYGEYPTFLKV